MAFRSLDCGSQAGYRVGSTRGEPEAARWRTLARLFHDDIAHAPRGGEWGSRGSARRLKKIAYTIAALAWNAKRRGLQMERAVTEWEADLEYLHGWHSRDQAREGCCARATRRTPPLGALGLSDLIEPMDFDNAASPGHSIVSSAPPIRFL